MSLLCKNQQRKKSTRKNAGRIIPLRPRKKQPPEGKTRRLFFAGAMPQKT